MHAICHTLRSMSLLCILINFFSLVFCLSTLSRVRQYGVTCVSVIVLDRYVNKLAMLLVPFGYMDKDCSFTAGLLSLTLNKRTI